MDQIDYMNEKIDMLSKLPEDKLKELVEFLKKQIRKEIYHGQQLQEKSDLLLKKGGSNHGNHL